MESFLTLTSPSSDHMDSTPLMEGYNIEHFHYLKFYYHLVFYLVISYIKLPLPTHGTMIIWLWDRSPLHMLPYHTHAHPTMSAHRHANTQPNLNDHNFSKYQGRSGLASHPKNVCTCTRVWHTAIMKIITQGLDENTRKRSLNQKQLGRTDSSQIPQTIRPYIMKSLNNLNLGVWILHQSQWCNKTKHHELTQLASIEERAFYVNPSVHEARIKVQKKP